MKIKCFLLAAIICISSSEIIASNVGDNGFVESDADFKRMHRNLLQTDDILSDDVESDKDEDDNTEEETKVKGLVAEDEERKGPLIFHDKDNNFLMQLEKPITITINNTNKRINVLLDNEASNIMGSYTKVDLEFKINIDWKSKPFGDIRGMGSIDMTFRKNNSEFTLIAMELSRMLVLDIRQQQMINLKVRTEYGYQVNAPLGLAFACDSPGMFKPTRDNTGLFGVTLPGVKLQVFKISAGNFGPLWFCGELMPIGLWVGLIVSLFFALICYYGFSMLASIQTMDRFDDPKGKTIHVPQTE